MGRLRICLFGVLQVSRGARAAEVPRSVQPLLAYLLLKRARAHPRTVLAGSLWSDFDESRALRCLSTALWRLRRICEDGAAGACHLLATSNGEIGFNTASPYWLDVEVFERRVSACVQQEPEALALHTVAKLERTVSLYHGDLLEVLDADWALVERERFRDLYLDALALLMRYYAWRKDWARSLAHGRRLIALDPLREDIHRTLMRLYLNAGERALAIRQYKTCQGVLGAELGIAPMEETQELYASVIATATRLRSPPAPVRSAVSLELAARKLRGVKQSLEASKAGVEDSLELIARAARTSAT